MLKYSTIEKLRECAETTTSALYEIGHIVENETSRDRVIASTDLAKLRTVEVRLSESAMLLIDLLEKHDPDFEKED